MRLYLGAADAYGHTGPVIRLALLEQVASLPLLTDSACWSC